MEKLIDEVINIIEHYINGKQLNIDSDDQPTIEKIILANKISSISLDLDSSNIKRQAFNEEFRALRMDQMFDIVIQEFAKENIDIIVLKGYVLKDLYPNPLHRRMGDIDFFVDPIFYVRSKKILSNLGYDFSDEGEGEVAALKDGICLELHQKLGYFPYPYLENYLEHLVLYKGKNVYTLDDLYFFLHNLGHAYFHISRGGIGLKYLLDFYFLLKNKAFVLDEMIPILQKNGLYNFFLLILNICLEHLDLKIHLSNETIEDLKKIDNNILNEFLIFMVYGGEYGMQNDPNKIILMRKNKNIFLIQKIFPNIRVIYKRQIVKWWYYPLLPFAYIGYLFKKIFHKATWKKLKNYNKKLDLEKERLFKYLGI